MAIYKHDKSGVSYAVLHKAFCVERQLHCFVYISLDTGRVFCRDIDDFNEKFTLIDKEPQWGIVRKQVKEN